MENTRNGDVVWIAAKYSARTKIGQQYNFTMRIYPGDETQLADSALEEQVGTGNQPAYRGLCYVVFESFNLSKYGNRIPNIEAEILTVPSCKIIEDYNVLTKMSGRSHRRQFVFEQLRCWHRYAHKTQSDVEHKCRNRNNVWHLRQRF